MAGLNRQAGYATEFIHQQTCVSISKADRNSDVTIVDPKWQIFLHDTQYKFATYKGGGGGGAGG